jgi:hypothetical protein
MTLTTMDSGANDLKQVWVFNGARSHFEKGEEAPPITKD